MKRRLPITICLLLVLALSTGLVVPATSKVIELTVVDNRGNQKDAELQEFWDWANRVTKATNGAIVFKYKGGPEVYPLFEAVDACTKGLFDVYTGVATYYSTLIPEALADALVQKGVIDLRKDGYNDIMNQIFAKHNLYYLMNHRGGIMASSGVFTTKPIGKPEELEGVKFRAKEPEDSMLKGWGATTVMVKATELYSAAQRGIVEGCTFPANASFMGRSLHEVFKFWVGPGFFRVTTMSSFNLKKWQSIPEAQRATMLKILDEVEKEWVVKWQGLINAEQAKLKTLVKRVEWSEGDNKKFIDQGYEAAWAVLMKKIPEWGPKLKAAGGSR